MRAAIFQGVGRGLAIEERPDPVPSAGEIVLRVARCGVCGSDLSMTSDHAGAFCLRPGATLGHEFSGEVVAIGRGVERLRIGDKVTALPSWGCGVCLHCRSGRPLFCVARRGGPAAFADYVLTAEHVALRLPNSLSFEDGALIEPMAVGLHGIGLVDVRDADVLVLGAGPVGLAAIYWARRRGVRRIVAVARSARNRALAEFMGADALLVDSAGEPLAEQVRAAFDEAPDIVLECVGAPGMIDTAVQLVCPLGTVLVLGFCTETDMLLPAAAAIKEVRLQFSIGYALADFETVARHFDAGRVEPRAMVSGRVTLEDLPAAFERLRNSRDHTKLMVAP